MKTQACSHPGSRPHGNIPQICFKANLPCTRALPVRLVQFPVCGAQRERETSKAPLLWQKKMSLHDESSLSQYLFCLTTELSQLMLTFHGKMPDVKKLSWLCLWLFNLLGHKVPEVIKNPWGCLKIANTTGTTQERRFLCKYTPFEFAYF